MHRHDLNSGVGRLHGKPTRKTYSSHASDYPLTRCSSAELIAVSPDGLQHTFHISRVNR